MSTPPGRPWEPTTHRGSRSDSASSRGPAGPPLHDSRSTWLTYETFYGLAEKPFSLSSDPRFFYHSPSHASAFDELLAGILRRESLSVLTGDIGMGKTTLCRSVIQSLDRKTFSAIVPDPFASREDLLKVLLVDFGVMSIDDLTRGRLKGASRTELSYVLYEFLDTLVPLQAFAVVIIDEAQNLSVPLLEEIRILSDSDGRDRQLQVVLVGQLELRQKLMLPEMRQVDQRVSVCSTLEALNRDGVAGYVEHRLHVAGGSPDRVSFSQDGLDLVYLKSGGVPRLINRICDRALHEGYLRRAASIDRELLESALSGARKPTSATASDSVPAAPHAGTRSVKRLDDWLTGVEIATKTDAATEQAEQTKSGGVAFSPEEEDGGDEPMEVDSVQADPAPAAKEWTRKGAVVFPRVVPPTHLQRVRQRWARRLCVAALCATALGVIRFAVLELQALLAEAAAPLPLADLPHPPPPSMPVAFTVPAVPDSVSGGPSASGNYVIQVGLFRSPRRAESLVQQLTSAGFRAYTTERDLDGLGVLEQVLIGTYATRAEADSDVERLQQRGDYLDARVADTRSR